MNKKRNITSRLGPLGLSLVAAGVTAIAFAAVSLAANGSGDANAGNGSGTQARQMPAPPAGGPGVAFHAAPNLSAADRKKMDEFRQCMQDNGAPAPPDPSDIGPSQGPPKPPSAADRQKVQKAYEACKDKLPAGMQNAGPPRIGTCGPPPGAPPQGGQQQNQNRDKSDGSGTSSSGSSS
jgi:hypothetical protein